MLDLTPRAGKCETLVRALGLAAQGPHSPAVRIRLGLHLTPLRLLGIDLRILPLLSDDQERVFGEASARQRARIVIGSRRLLASQLATFAGDTAIVQRQIDLLPSLSLEQRAAAGRRLVLDVDDPIWLDSDRRAGGHPLAFLKGTRRKVVWLARRADRVLAGNELLADWLSQHTDAVTVVPSTVDPQRVPIRSHSTTRKVILGWIGSRTTVRYLHALSPVLAGLSRSTREFDFELHVVGGHMPKVDGLRVVLHRWSEPAERAVLDRMDVGLMPLPDDPWARGKCAYKALQYMAAGVPVVADDVGITATVIGDGEAGLIVSRPRDWIEGIVHLARDPGLRNRLGASGRRRVEADFSTARWAPVLAAAIRGEPVARSHSGPMPGP